VLWKLGCCDLRRRNRRFSSLHGMLNPTSSILLPTCRAVRTPTNARIPAGDRRFLLLYGIQTPSPANPLSPQGNASQPGGAIRGKRINARDGDSSGSTAPLTPYRAKPFDSTRVRSNPFDRARPFRCPSGADNRDDSRDDRRCRRDARRATQDPSGTPQSP
jgi:hypothetical protein